MSGAGPGVALRDDTAPAMDDAPDAALVVARPRRRIGPLLVLGFLLVQLAWVLAMPPYSGTDEVDHAYRAAAVAAGQVVAPETTAAYGTGAWVTPPDDIVTAAAPQCRALPYTAAVNCSASEELGAGLVSVPSSAGRYNPAYYAVVGAAALPFDGYGALYAMRLMSIALCTAFLALAVWCLDRFARGPAPVVALVIAATPMVLFSGAIVAPNGVEMTAAVALWCALLGLMAVQLSSRDRRGLVAAAAVSACVLATVRALGPLWLVLIVIAVLALQWPRRALESVRTCLRSRTGLVGCAVVGLTALAGGIWTLWFNALDVAHDGRGSLDPTVRLSLALRDVPLWVLQSMGAFPFRGNPAPPLTYACLLVALGVLMVLAWRWASRRARVVLGSIAGLGLLIPFVITMASVSSYGNAWQGRYTLPFTLGLPLVAGYLLDGPRRGSSWRGWSRRNVVVCGALVVIAHVASVVAVLDRQLQRSPLSGSSVWVTASGWAVGGLALLGALLIAAAAVSVVPTTRSQVSDRGRGVRGFA